MAATDIERINLEWMKHNWYEKGINNLTIFLYVRDADDVTIDFQEEQIVINFMTGDHSFLKIHGNGEEEHQYFTYIMNLRGRIDPKECRFKVKKTSIEIVAKKLLPVKWSSLENLSLQGGKSTPLTKTANDDGKQEVEVENAPGPSITKDKRNIQKSVVTASHSDSQLGMIGLENYANNCYMNVVVQILCNLQEIRDYFRNDHYIKDINANNPLGSGGKVAKAFADVAKALWMPGRKSIKPLALKNIMGKQCSLFLGWQQHDAQEFFASLLDNLHEDLNHAFYEKPCYEKLSDRETTKTSEVESVANEKPDTAWSSHLKRNNSFIVKLFHGQLMSKLTCATCHKISYSFDPCAQISLPIPSNKQLVKILFFTRDSEALPLMISLQISTPKAQVWHLVNMLQSLVRVPPHLIAVFNGVNEVLTNGQISITSLLKYRYIVCSEICSKDEDEFISIPVFQYLTHATKFVFCEHCFKSDKELKIKLKRCTRCMAVAYCSRECQSKHWQTHSKLCSKDIKVSVGIPFYITINKNELSYQTLEENLRRLAKHSIEVTNNGAENNENNVDVTFNCNFVIKSNTKMNVNDETSTNITSDNLNFDMLSKVSSLLIEWQTSPRDEETTKSAEISSRSVPIHEALSTDTIAEESKCTLSDCLKLFMEPERLDEKESWKCPKCKAPRAAKKEMALSCPPCLLLLHLKRFTYGEYGQKINKAVSYPLSDFDLTNYVAKETRSKIDYPLKYDLVGVMTHRGTMRMGHYTCMVRLLNQQDQEEVGWRHFDDDSSMKIKMEKVVSPDAYVLVYRLRGSQNIMKMDRCPSLHSSSSSSLHGETNTVKRKRSDQVPLGKSNSIDRRSASENVLNRMKRSISMDSNSDSEGKSNVNRQKSETCELRRCASAVPPTRPHISKEDIKTRLTSGSASDIKLGEKVDSGTLLNSSSDESLECNQCFATKLPDGTDKEVLGESFCESFEVLNIEQEDLEKSLHDVTWVDSQQYFDDEDIISDSEIKECQGQDYMDETSEELEFPVYTSNEELPERTVICDDNLYLKDIDDIDENDLD